MEISEFLTVFAFGVVFTVSINYLVNRRALSMVRQAANTKGRQAQIEYADERQAALAEAVAIFQGEGTSNEKLKKGVGLIAKYPNSAAWLIKQFRTFQREGLAGLIDME